MTSTNIEARTFEALDHALYHMKDDRGLYVYVSITIPFCKLHQCACIEIHNAELRPMHLSCPELVSAYAPEYVGVSFAKQT